MRGAVGGTAAATGLALLAFAGNSLLTRLALAPPAIGAGAFSAIRLASGALVLAALARVEAGDWRWLRGGRPLAPVALTAYAVPFTIAYLRIGAAAGALVLFGTVQLTMLAVAMARGERPSARAWAGLVLAVSGLAAFTLPAAGRPDVGGLALMALAGVAWGGYTLLGRGAGAPIVANAFAFTWSVPLALAALLLVPPGATPTLRGVGLAIASGAVTSGLGYAVWYRALRGLGATTAAAVQLAVPIVAAAGAWLLLGEPVGVRLVLCGAAVLGGIGLVVASRPPR